jgi:hypothetical protein
MSSEIHQRPATFSIRFSGGRDLDLADMEETAFNPKRRLCPDGSCVGVLGADGRCSVCQGRAGAAGGSLAEAAPAAWAAPSSDDASPTEMANAAAYGFDPSRRLCDDGSCVGVVGANGSCGTCGRKAD